MLNRDKAHEALDRLLDSARNVGHATARTAGHYELKAVTVRQDDEGRVSAHGRGTLYLNAVADDAADGPSGDGRHAIGNGRPIPIG